MNADRRSWLSLAAAWAGLGVFFVFGAASEMRRYPVGAGLAAAIYVCLLLLVGLMLVPGFPASRAWARGRVGRFALALFLLPYLIYAAGAGDFRWQALGKLAALAVGPLLLYRMAPVARPRRMNWQDLVVLAWLALPILLGWIRRIWVTPVNLDFMTRMFLLAAGAWAFVVFRDLADTGYECRLSWRGLRDALVGFAAFGAIAIPLGLALRFIAWNPHWRGLGQFGFDFVTIFLFIGLPEELFFRGALQNLLEATWSSRYRAQAAASVLFGFSHILHAPVPNWRYVILASIAGWFYGSAYRNTRSLPASATTHALVDAVWRTWFRLVAR